jgi:hypothetical protein
LAIASGGLGIGTTPTDGQLAIGNGTSYVLATLTGTANQVMIAVGSGTTTPATIQPIAPSSSPTFAALTLGTPLSAANGGTGLSTTPTNGRILIGNAPGFSLSTLTGTSAQIIIVNGAGTITISLAAVGSGTGTCGGDGNLCLITFDANGRLGFKINDTAVTITSVSGTTTGCFTRAYSFTLQKTIVTTGSFAAIDLRISQLTTGSTNALNCLITFDTAIPAGYRPLSTMAFPVNVNSNTSGLVASLTVTSAGVVTISAYTDIFNIFIISNGFPANIPDFRIGEFALTYFSFS